MHRQTGRLVAHHKPLVLKKHLQIRRLGLQGTVCLRQTQLHQLAPAQLAGGRNDRQAVDAALSGRDGLLHRRTRHALKPGMQRPVKAFSRLGVHVKAELFRHVCS